MKYYKNEYLNNLKYFITYFSGIYLTSDIASVAHLRRQIAYSLFILFIKQCDVWSFCQTQAGKCHEYVVLAWWCVCVCVCVYKHFIIQLLQMHLSVFLFGASLVGLLSIPVFFPVFPCWPLTFSI